MEDTNGDGYTWETVGWAGMAHTPPNSMAIMYNPAIDMNDWFFSPQIWLTGGTTYRLTVTAQACVRLALACNEELTIVARNAFTG